MNMLKTTQNQELIIESMRKSNMTFLLQETTQEEIEIAIVKDTIKQSLPYKTGIINYEMVSIENITNSKYKTGIPIGSIEFIEKWLSYFYNKPMKPIEVPPILRTEEFLKRKYTICNPDKFPQKGRYFLKNAEKLKDWTYCGDISQSPPLKNNLYVVSEEVVILSEWRAYIINNKIENISNYDGDSMKFPDSELIQKAVKIYSADKNCPKSYTIDIMVTNRGTAIIEIHPFVSVGLYSTLWGTNLLDAYQDGIEYYKKQGQ